MVLLLLGGVCAAPALGQSAQADRARADALSRRVADRVAALQREADQLAARSRTLLEELRTAEIERDLQIALALQADEAATAAAAALAAATARIDGLERARAVQIPDLERRFVDLYKRGRSGYAGLVLGGNSIREIGRTTRAVASLARLTQVEVADHRRTLEALRAERLTLEQRQRALQAQQAAAAKARAAADKAVATRAALISRIDSRRDLTAQFSSELQAASDQLRRQLSDLANGRSPGAVSVPIAPFRGALDWPAGGRVRARFGETTGRTAGAAGANGIEIDLPEGAPVHAVHGGTVAYADPFTGFGTLVILDHGNASFSLYGYLARTALTRGDRVEAGGDIGQVGLPPNGPAGLYFEMRIDGRSVDPLQWLKAR